MSEKTLKTAFWAAGIALILVGSWAWVDRFFNEHEHTNYGSVVPWGLWVAAYIYFIGLSAGSFLVSSLVFVFRIQRFEPIGRLALFTSLVTLLLALLSISADLGHTFRAWHVQVYPNFESPMAWMIWLYSAYAALVSLELWFVYRHDFVTGQREPGLRGRLYRLLSFGSRETSEAALASDRQIVRILAVAGIPLVLMFNGGVGSLFAVVAARPAWSGGLFPLLFIVSAMASGAALLALVSAIFQDGLRRNRETVLALGALALALLLVDVFIQASEIIVGLYGNEPDKVGNLNLVFSGPYWWVFWFWQLGLGTLIPLAILVLPSRREPHLVAVACGLIVVGFLALRLNIVIPGLADEQFIGLTRAFDSARMTTDYVPSLMEFSFTAGIVGIGLVLFGIGEWLLPNSRDRITYPEATPAPAGARLSEGVANVPAV